ncbi:MAG: hypothetical protein PHF18_16425 [Methanosarcina sp.]|uniref:hypothetical protein n=1 Tax=Methanosarcina sp. TaxID=2213 RepID=UPI0026284E78|nr:hypothetical protein [Methanosarcina sp.]MDD3248417.1 hypothetical protein [Methanosarcina sp.]MDD4248064.1 hypothetical protein [Methanosarcina sp.]
MRDEQRSNGPRKIEAFDIENKKWSGSLTEAVKVLAVLVFALAMATVILLILVPEVGLLMRNIFVTVFSAMIMAISVLAFIFLVIYIYEVRLKVRYEGKLKEINASLQQLSSPLRVAIITGMNLIFLAMVNLFWTGVLVAINISGDKPPEIVPLLSPQFAEILPYLNLLIISTIIANLLYLVIKSKWVPMTIETVLSITSAVLLYAVLMIFPFNPVLNSSTLLAIKLSLGFVLVMTLMGAAKNLLKTITLLLQK